jgi:hypothetical protein
MICERLPQNKAEIKMQLEKNIEKLILKENKI